MKALAVATVLLAVSLQQTTAPQPIDPVGKWTFATQTAEGQAVPVTDVFTSPTQIVLILQLPNSSVVAKVARGADGKFTGSWGEIAQTMGITVERVK